LAGRRLAVNFAAKRPTVERTPNDPSPTLFVGNLSYDVTDRELNAMIRDVRVAIDRRTGQPRGFAHADFTDVDSCVSARRKLEGTEIRGRPLKLDFSHSSRNAVALATYSKKEADGSEMEDSIETASEDSTETIETAPEDSIEIAAEVTESEAPIDEATEESDAQKQSA
jgi:RNA recognition motif-containing protein